MKNAIKTTASFSVLLLAFVLAGVSPLKAQDNNPQVFDVLSLDENLGFLNTVNQIMASLDDLHANAQAETERSVQTLIKKGELRRLMSQDVECQIPFESSDYVLSNRDRDYLKSFLNSLDSISDSYNAKFDKTLAFEIAVLGYTDESGTPERNAKIAQNRAENSAKYLSKWAKDNNLDLSITQIVGHPNKNPNGGEPCGEENPECRVCKIVLTRLISQTKE